MMIENTITVVNDPLNARVYTLIMELGLFVHKELQDSNILR